ncbi:threonine/homoserine efflux transporter RhtA [Cytobacillus oceanisediminis]|uniref:Threonine/homoserine efflux transporter RhtA n=1 Tax=Cytobacillus oceanisediminis TaxID=665099 RepID=A0A2V2ZFZ2_9BACI|nr:DMT family transporter [Cytobacillus oceanisediminis]PWW17160.1 threonine/homoserine efflux transporter RhtA [Cytobacillus oceanisediminis]
MSDAKINPYVALAIGVISVSTSAILVKVSSAPSGVIAFYRLFFSVLFMLPVFLIKYVPELRLITRRDWVYSLVAGVFLAFHFILWFESLNYTSVASSTVLVTLQPLFAFAGTYFFFKEKFTWKAILSGLLAIGGSVIISWGDFKISGSALFGDILALIACALVTAYLMFGQAVRKRLSLITYTFVVYSISTVTLLLYVLIVQEPLLPYATSDWVYFILLALIPTLLGHTLFNWSLKWLSTSTISMAILFEPVGAAVLAYYLLQESVVWTQVLGGAIVIGGISLFLLDERRLRMKELKKKTTISG